MWLVVRETCDRLRDISPDFAGDGMVRMRHRCGNRRERAFRDDDRGHQAGCRTPAQAFGAHRHQQKPRADHYDQSGASTAIACKILRELLLAISGDRQ